MSAFATDLAERLQAVLSEIIEQEPNDLEHAGLRAAADLRRFIADVELVDASTFAVMAPGWTDEAHVKVTQP